jgi:hypothetical protein
MRSIAHLFLATALASAAQAAVQDPALDLEAELGRVTAPPPRLEIRYAPLDEPEFALEEVALELDGQPARVPSAAEVRAGAPILSAPVAPGIHKLVVRLSLVTDFGRASYRTGYRFKLGKRISIEARQGLLHQLEVRPQRESSLSWEQSLGLNVSRKEQMLAALETGEMPAPPPRLLPRASVAAGSKVEEEEEPAAQPEAFAAPRTKAEAKPALATRDPSPRVKLARASATAAAPIRPPPLAAAATPAELEAVAKPGAPESPRPVEPVTMVQALVEKQPEPESPAPPQPAAAPPSTAPEPSRVAARLGLALLAVSLLGLGFLAYRRRHRSAQVSPPSASSPVERTPSSEPSRRQA